MKILKCTILILLMGLFGSLQAQDIHWSLYQMSPLTLNPALTGAFNGTVRVGGIYRDQARTIVTNAYTTPSFYVDAPILNVGKRDWVGVGGMLYNDQAGVAGLATLGAYLSASYHKALNKKGTSLISFGVQGGMMQRRVDTDKLIFEDGILKDFAGGNDIGFNNSDDLSRIENSSAFDLNAGITISSQVNKQTDLTIGISLYHILKPNYGLLTGPGPAMGGQAADPDSSTLELPRRFQLHGLFNFDLNKKWTLSPGFLYGQIGPANEFQIQTMLGYVLNKKNNTVFKFGPGYRIGDAAQFLLGLDMKDLKVAASYDMTLSGLSDINSGVGGFEIAASYIIKIFKAPTVKPVIFCPRF